MNGRVVIDSSALIAIGLNEPDAQWFANVIAHADDPVMSAGTLQEVIAVFGHRIASERTSLPNADAGEIDALDLALGVLRTTTLQGIRIIPVDASLAVLGAAGSVHYRRAPARLNFGDGFAYALARFLDAPIVCKGEDFVRTNVTVIRPPSDRAGAEPSFE